LIERAGEHFTPSALLKKDQSNDRNCDEWKTKKINVSEEIKEPPEDSGNYVNRRFLRGRGK
jgi:hypothetical protein